MKFGSVTNHLPKLLNPTNYLIEVWINNKSSPKLQNPTNDLPEISKYYKLPL